MTQETPVTHQNRYDKHDMVKREAVLIAGPLKLAAYRVRDSETLEWSKMQFHMTHDNTVMAVMSEEAAKLFSGFVNDIMSIIDDSKNNG
jgi:hypothetical protein